MQSSALRVQIVEAHRMPERSNENAISSATRDFPTPLFWLHTKIVFISHLANLNLINYTFNHIATGRDCNSPLAALEKPFERSHMPDGIGSAREGEAHERRQNMDDYGIKTYADLAGTVGGMVLANEICNHELELVSGECAPFDEVFQRVHHQRPRLPHGAHRRAGIP